MLRPLAGMSEPLSTEHHPASADTEVLSTFYPVPGFGLLPINAFLLRAAEPVLVDAGVLALRSAFLAALEDSVDLDDLRWIWLTHTDPDHLGCLDEVLAAAPQARVVTTFLGMGKLGLSRAVPPERVLLLNPGQTLDVGDRRLRAVKPPSYDAPETTGMYDEKTRALFSSDCFGALLAEPADAASAIEPKALRDGLVTWATVDAPWLSSVDPARFEAAVRSLEELRPAFVLSSHLPPAAGMFDTLAAHLREARTAPPFVGPDQKALSDMLAAE